MNIVFLGTNGWYTNQTGNTACVLLDTKDHYIILDAGNGFYKLNEYITEDKPVSLFISHFHLDHVSGLHTLGKFAFPKGLDVYVGIDRKRDFATLVNPPYTIGFQENEENIKNLKMPVRIHELHSDLNELPFPVTAVEQHHAYKNHGFRFFLEEKIIAYSGDCGISENSKKLVENADVLIHECALKHEISDTLWGHVNPMEAASVAKEYNVKKLLLTHFDPLSYPTLADRKKAQDEAKTIFPDTTAAYDDMIITV